MKVYCKNCKNRTYRYYDNDPGFYTECHIYEKDYDMGQHYKYYTPRDKNKNGDCGDYKRVWWKFWVKSNPKEEI